MKKILSFAMAAAFVFGLASCTKETDNGVGGDSYDGAALQFSFKTDKGSLVTYAIAEGSEWTIGDVDIYAFTGGTLVGKMEVGTDIKVTTGPGTINYAATPAWLGQNAGKTLNFYFVANDAASTGGAHMPATIPTAEADFVELLTNELPDSDTDTEHDQIQPVLLFSALSDNITLNTKVQKTVELTRREARFDIVNDMYESLQVNEILISNASLKGNLFGAAAGTNAVTYGNLEPVAGPATGDYVSEEGAYIAKSVFYLYPTTIKTDGTGTEIVINATLDGEAENYIVRKRNEVTNALEDIAIEANHRYKLVLDPIELEFYIVAADYEEGGNIDTELGSDDAIGFGTFTYAGGASAANLTANVYDITDAAGGTITFDATTVYGTKARIVYAVGDQNDALITTPIAVEKTASATTYSGVTTTDTYEITVPVLSDNTKTFDFKVEIYSPGNAETVETYSFTNGAVIAGTTQDIKDNLGVTDETFAQWIIDNVDNGNGVITPADLESVTEIDFFEEGKEDLTSVAGIENFSNLKRLVISYNPGITALDLSNNPALEIVETGYCNIYSINIENTPNLRKLTLAGNPITEIDFQHPNLEYLQIGTGDAEFSYNEIDLSGMPKLDTLTIRGINKEVLKIEHPQIRNFNYYGVSPKGEAFDNKDLVTHTLDLSALPNLNYLNIQTMPNLETMPGFESHRSDLLRLGMSYCPKITSFDFDSYAALKRVGINNCVGLETVKFNDCPVIDNIAVSNNNNLTTLDLGNINTLNSLALGATMISNIDISENRNLTLFNVNSNKNADKTITVNVWTGFDTTTPANSIADFRSSNTVVNWTGHE